MKTLPNIINKGLKVVKGYISLNSFVRLDFVLPIYEVMLEFEVEYAILSYPTVLRKSDVVSPPNPKKHKRHKFKVYSEMAF